MLPDLSDPEPAVHLTLDLGSQAKFGPDAEWLGTPACASIRHGRSVFTPRFAAGGVRPKIAGPGMPDADFRIDGPDRHGVPGLIHLLGIESPGLMAEIANGCQIAREIAGR
ncbi:hypothetical protein PA01_01710 [Azoarcus sp. PA01]|nr:hypothetical protein PA01_01710 [Azoarcus sp. PA01]